MPQDLLSVHSVEGEVGDPKTDEEMTPGRSPPCSRAARACYVRRRSQWSMTAMRMVAA
jgi:hypothetical protein